MADESQAKPLPVGAVAPDIEAETYDGVAVSLKALRGQSVLVYFYPKDSTPGCTAQACNLRDNFESLGKAGIAVIGVSPDPLTRHEKFAAKYELPFPLVADPDRDVIEAYGVWGTKRNYGKTYQGLHRTSFLIDADGAIRHVFTKPKTKAHAEEVLLALTED